MKTFFSKYCSAALPVRFAGKLGLCLFAMTVGGKNRLFGFTLCEGNAQQNFGKSTNIRTVSKDMIHLKCSQKFTFQITGVFYVQLSAFIYKRDEFSFPILAFVAMFMLPAYSEYRFQISYLVLIAIIHQYSGTQFH